MVIEISLFFLYVICQCKLKPRRSTRHINKHHKKETQTEIIWGLVYPEVDLSDVFTKLEQIGLLSTQAGAYWITF